jgi:excisionase family DNA binding protein
MKPTTSEAWPPAYLTALEVAELLRVSVKSVYRWVKDDPSLPALRLSGTVRFPRERLERWLRDREQGPARPRRLPKQERQTANPLSPNGLSSGSSPVGQPVGRPSSHLRLVKIGPTPGRKLGIRPPRGTAMMVNRLSEPHRIAGRSSRRASRRQPDIGLSDG